MHISRLLRLTVSLGVMAAITAAPAAAQVVETEPCKDEEGNLVFTELVQWIKAPENRFGNFGAVSEATGEDFGDYPTWSGEAPTESVEDGAGGASIQQRAGNAVGNEFNREAAGHFEGAFEGCLNAIAWDQYLLSPVPPTGGAVTTIIRLVIDGQTVYVPATNMAPAINAPSEGDTGLLYRMQFVFTGLYQLMNSSPSDFAPLEGEHTIEATMFSQFVNDAQGAYVYDTTEVPSRLTFNKATGLGAYTKIETFF
jgi:hypothetical protein